MRCLYTAVPTNLPPLCIVVFLTVTRAYNNTCSQYHYLELNSTINIVWTMFVLLIQLLSTEVYDIINSVLGILHVVLPRIK